MPVISVLIDGCSTLAVAAVCLWVLRRFDSYTKLVEQSRTEGRQALDALSRLHALTTRVAVEMDQHSNQVEAINDRLITAGHPAPALVIAAVAQLVEVNQQMQNKLTATEDQLREQARQIEIRSCEARTDVLTLLANRRAFTDELPRRIDEFRRQGRGFSLIMVDVDHFKAFNDVHGHETGDEVLRGVARAIRRKMREMDLVTRYGGEEFSIILPGTPLGDACKAALRVKEAVKKFRLELAGEILQVTASFGVAEVQAGETSAELLKRTDMALYASKQAGRDCVHGHDGDSVHLVLDASKSPSEPARAAAEIRKPDGRETELPPRFPAAGANIATEVDMPDGLPDRNMFCQHVRNRMAEWNRGGTIFSVLLAKVRSPAPEVENGNPPRPPPLQVVLRLVTSAVREMDLLGIYNSDCLAVLLPSGALGDAIRVAQRIQDAFLKWHDSAEQRQPRLTLCIGMTQVGKGDDFLTLLKRAEETLEAADQEGGNPSYCHDGEHCVPMSEILERTECVV
jgi:diguanylate cyclase